MNIKNILKISKYKILKIILISLFVFITIISIGGYFYINSLLKVLPKFDKLEKYEPSLVTRIYSADSVVIKKLFSKNRNPVDLNNLPKSVIEALVATEDRDFFHHWGFSVKSTFRAAIFGLPRKLIGKSMRGASTITQQLARNLYNEIGFKKNIERKIKELLTAIKLETMYSKKEILEMYFTQCYFGESAYGIQSGAMTYFGKNAKDLLYEESALLIAQLKAPSHYNPFKKPGRALKRRNTVLSNMYKMQFIDKKTLDSLKNTPIKTIKKQSIGIGIAPYFTEYIRQQLNSKNAKYNFDYLKDGLNIETTLNSKIQKIAEESMLKNLDYLNNRVKKKFISDKKNGLSDYVKAHFDSARWEAKMLDTLMIDSIAKKELMPQVALIAIKPQTGHVLAMIGGTNFEQTKYNRAMQAWRQPGSIFKPINYLTALDNGYSPSTEVLNQPVVIYMNGKRWSPSNYERENIGGKITLRKALEKSLNLISARVITELITPKEVVSYAKRLGINTKNIHPYPSIALGAGEVRPIDIVTAYSAIANKGTLIKPIMITKIKDKNNRLIEENTPEKSVAISEETAYLITNMMEGVVNNGTGRRLRWKYNFKPSVAGKTGTTNDYTDAWFCGFTPEIAIVVWVGLDNRKYKLGKGSTGANMALPIWGSFISELYKSKELNYKKFKDEKFTIPDGVEEIEICGESKQIAGPYCPKIEKEIFNKQYAPTEKCKIHSGGSIENNDIDSGRY